MASRSPAIFLLLALPLLCYVVSIEAHTLPDDIVPDSRGLSDNVVPESSLDDDEMDEFMQATSRSRLTKGGGQGWEDQQEWLQARATKGLNDGLLQSRVTRVVDDDDEMDQFMQATSRSRLTKGVSEAEQKQAEKVGGCPQRRLLGRDSDSSGC